MSDIPEILRSGAVLLLAAVRRRKRLRMLAGAAGWTAVLLSGWLVLRAELAARSGSLTKLSAEVGRWVFHSRTVCRLECPQDVVLALDDPIFMETGDGQFVQVGFVSDVDGTRSRSAKKVRSARAVIYRKALSRFSGGVELRWHATPMNLRWVMQMLIPPERRAEIVALVQEEWGRHQRHVIAELKPVVKDGLRRMVLAIEAEVPAILERHREDFQRLGRRFEMDVLQRQLLPLARDEILPVVQEEVQPLAMEIAAVLWDRVSLLSFAWRYLYDVSPLPRRNAVRQEFERFIDEEVVPELESRTDEFVEVTRAVLRRLMNNERVQAGIRDSLVRMAEDRLLQKLVWDMLKEALLENERLHEQIDLWLSDRATQAAMRDASDRMELMVRRIGDLVFGSRQTGVTPEFARVLRSQILSKDRRWLVMVPADGTGDTTIIPVAIAQEPMLYPQRFAGTAQSPLTPEFPRAPRSPVPQSERP